MALTKHRRGLTGASTQPNSAPILFMLIALLFSACGGTLEAGLEQAPPAPTDTLGAAPSNGQSTATAQPDLAILRMYLEMEGRHSDCVAAYAPYGIRVVVGNVGNAPSEPFVVDVNGTHQRVEAGLAAGQSIELHFGGTTPGGLYTARVVSERANVEVDEGNNSQTYTAPTPSPPPLCTAISPTLTLVVSEVPAVSTAAATSLPPPKTPTFSPTLPPPTTSPASPAPSVTAAITVSPTASAACQYTWFFTHAPSRCPVEPPILFFGATQRFEHGQMIWVKASDTFFILFNAGALPNDSRPAFIQYQSLRLKPGASPDNRVGETPPSGLYEPVSGFGLIWRGEVEGEFSSLGTLTMQQALGWAVEPESGFDTAHQCETSSTYSDRTCYLRAADGRIIVLGYGAYTGNVWWVYVWQ